MLHELAHAWDDTSGAVDRAGFMKLRGVSVWFGGLDVPFADQGSEHLAIIIAWGLMDPGAGSAHGLPNNTGCRTHRGVRVPHGPVTTQVVVQMPRVQSPACTRSCRTSG